MYLSSSFSVLTRCIISQFLVVHEMYYLLDVVYPSFWLSERRSISLFTRCITSLFLIVHKTHYVVIHKMYYLLVVRYKTSHQLLHDQSLVTTQVVTSYYTTSHQLLHNQSTSQLVTIFLDHVPAAGCRTQHIVLPGHYTSRGWPSVLSITGSQQHMNNVDLIPETSLTSYCPAAIGTS